MTDAVVVREARAGDAGFIAAANAAMALETEDKRLDRATLEQGVRAVLADAARGFYLVAEQEGVVVGCVLVTREWSDWRNADWWWLQSVYVLPEARRRGVFRALQGELRRRAAAASGVAGLRLYVERDNQSAQATYAALGFAGTAYRMLEWPIRGDAP
ncbi:MAG: GNAT family N-acetyltransferase [Xanthomonadales bacterium]|nr:GNAT family N-acetyltransferase [Xanthomonadales bacterium]